jgi:hypothetical protein
MEPSPANPKQFSVNRTQADIENRILELAEEGSVSPIKKLPSASAFQAPVQMLQESPTSEVIHLNEEHNQSRPSTSEEPLLFIDVNITPTHTERLEVFEGDTPEQLAKDFCEKHNLPEKMYNKLVNLLGIQMEEME